MTNQEDDRFEAEIAEAIQQDYAMAQREARVPRVEIVWLHAQMRAREEAVRKTMRPVIIGQAVGVAAFAGLLISLLSRLSLNQLPPLPLTLIELVVGSWLVLAPVALYLTFARD
jgi:hypothetical protein